jgi:hypothetical protein
MKKRDFIALIWENLMRRKARVALTAVGVVVGTASILILVSLIGALKQNAAESLFGISEMRKITVMPGYGESSDEEDNFFGGMYVDAEESGQRTPTAPLNQSAVAYLTALPGVESVVLMDGLTGYGTLTFAKTEAYATILGVKTGSNAANPLGNLVNKELFFIGIGTGLGINQRHDLLLFRISRGLQLLIIIEGQGMKTNVGVNDKLLTGQPDTIVGNLTFGKGLFRNGQVHHDLGLGLRQVTEIFLSHPKYINN